MPKRCNCTFPHDREMANGFMPNPDEERCTKCGMTLRQWGLLQDMEHDDPPPGTDGRP